MLTIRLFLKILPWTLVVVLAIILGFFFHTTGSFNLLQNQTLVVQNTILKEVEMLGKLELVRYNFKDITELERKSDSWVSSVFKADKAKMALLTAGTATGCIDLTRIVKHDISVSKDTVYLQLPEAELCYYKLDMDKTHIYSLYSEWRVDEKAFIQEGYRLAEKRIRDSALESGILEQTNRNAELILKPLLEKISGKFVVFAKRPDPVKVDQSMQ